MRDGGEALETLRSHFESPAPGNLGSASRQVARPMTSFVRAGSRSTGSPTSVYHP